MCLPFRGMRRQDTECPAEPYACGKDPVFKPRCGHGSIPCQPLLPARGNPCERYPDGFRASELGPFCGNRTAETVPDSHGDTIFVPGDKVYIAGGNKDVGNFISWISEETSSVKTSRIVIAGATITGRLLASALCADGYDVRFIEKNQQKGEKLLDTLPPGILVINGDPTDEEVLEEAGIRDCEGFVSAASDDEDNILSCIMAKRMGARKTVTVTSKPEYIRIVPTMDMIDCGFSTTLTAVNSILRMLESGTMRIDAFLQMFHARLTEFRVSNSSPLCGKELATCNLPSSTLFALAFRKDEIIAPSGNTILQPGDTVVAIVTPEVEKELEPLFPEK